MLSLSRSHDELRFDPVPRDLSCRTRRLCACVHWQLARQSLQSEVDSVAQSGQSFSGPLDAEGDLNGHRGVLWLGLVHNQKRTR